MIWRSLPADARSCARSLERFGEALKPSPRFSDGGFARARAHPPIPPPGAALERRPPGSLERARARASERRTEG